MSIFNIFVCLVPSGCMKSFPREFASSLLTGDKHNPFDFMAALSDPDVMMLLYELSGHSQSYYQDGENSIFLFLLSNIEVSCIWNGKWLWG